MAPKKAYPFYHASAWVNIVSENKRRARGGSDGLSAGLLVDWAHLFRGHIFGSLERRTKKGDCCKRLGGALHYADRPWMETLRSVRHECTYCC